LLCSHRCPSARPATGRFGLCARLPEPLLRRRPDDIAAVSKPLGVTSAIAIECGLSDKENWAQRQVAAESDHIRGYAPHVDLESPDLERKLKAWNSDPKCVGVRMRFEGYPDRTLFLIEDQLIVLSFIDGSFFRGFGLVQCFQH
jgi:predicted TIM-barrel fold metal-dependent hydrolase